MNDDEHSSDVPSPQALSPRRGGKLTEQVLELVSVSPVRERGELTRSRSNSSPSPWGEGGVRGMLDGRLDAYE